MIRHALNVGGIPVTSDVFLMEKQQTFNRSKTVERHIHACGSGAFGYFVATADVSNLCKVQFLKGLGTKTPCFVRFIVTVDASSGMKLEIHGSSP
jgi:catalase